MNQRAHSILAILAASLLFAAAPAQAGVYEEILQAATTSDTGKVVDLLKRGMDVNTADQDGNTLMMIAVRENNLDLVRFLLDNRANAQRRNSHGDTALMLAALLGHEEIVKLMLERKVDPSLPAPGWNALHYAAFENRARILTMLLNAGADINALAPNGSTALMLAAKRGHLDAARVLVNRHAELNHIDRDEGTALDMAKKAGHVEIINLLRRVGAR